MHILVIFDHLGKTIRPETTADVLNRWKHGGKVPVFFLFVCLFVFFAGRSVTFLFSVFISHVIKTKNRNRSINKFKNLGYDR